MNLLVTGATGYIGQAAVCHALQAGHQVTALTRNRQSVPTLLRDSVNWLEGTLADPPLASLQAAKVDACVHAAWIATPGVYLESPENLALVDETESLAVRLGGLGIRKFLALGTCIEYAPNAQILTEDVSPVGPLSLYGRCKVQTHDRLKNVADKHGFELLWGRVFFPYGIGEHPARLVSSFIKQMRADKVVTLRTPDSIKDFIYIADLAAAIILLAEKGTAGTYNLCTGIGTSILEMAQLVQAHMHKSNLIETIPQPGLDSYPVVIGSAKKLLSLGWQPQISLIGGLQKMTDSQPSNKVIS